MSEPTDELAPATIPVGIPRRGLLRGGAIAAGVAVGGVAAAALSTPGTAHAADGDPVLAGDANEATATTGIKIGDTNGSEDPALSLENDNGPSLYLQPLAADFAGFMGLGQVANTTLGPVIGVNTEVGEATTFLATGVDLADLPTPVALNRPIRVLDTRTAAGRARVFASSPSPYDSAFRLKAGAYLDVEVSPVAGDFALPTVYLNVIAVDADGCGVPRRLPTSSERRTRYAELPGKPDHLCFHHGRDGDGRGSLHGPGVDVQGDPHPPRPHRLHGEGRGADAERRPPTATSSRAPRRPRRPRPPSSVRGCGRPWSNASAPAWNADRERWRRSVRHVSHPGRAAPAPGGRGRCVDRQRLPSSCRPPSAASRWRTQTARPRERSPSAAGWGGPSTHGPVSSRCPSRWSTWPAGETAGSRSPCPGSRPAPTRRSTGRGGGPAGASARPSSRPTGTPTVYPAEGGSYQADLSVPLDYASGLRYYVQEGHLLPR